MENQRHQTVMKIATLILLGSVLCASGQYRYNLHQVGPAGTNATHPTFTISNYQANAVVGPSTWADVQLRFSCLTNEVDDSNIVIVVRTSIDASNWRDSQSFTSAANGTNIVCDLFRVQVTNAAYLQLYSLTNATTDTLTNLTVKIGNKVGL